MNDELKISKILELFIKKNNLKKGLEKVDAKDAWHHIMRNGVSNYTTNVQLKNGVLYVNLNSSALREELSYGKEKIIIMMNKTLKKETIKKLVLR